jgi:hypothetical protein
MNRLSFRGPVAVRQLRRAHGGRESRRIALYTWVLVLLLCCNLASTEDFTYAEGFTSAALGQLAAGSAFVGPDRHVSGAAYMCLLTADFLGPAAHAQQCSTFSWYFIQGGASGGSWPTKQHSKDFEFCTDGHQAKPRSIHLLYTWKSANQDKVGLLRAPRAASGSGLTLSYDKNVHTVLNEDLWSMLPSSGKKAMCWTGPGRRLVVLDNSETGKYPHSSSCFKLRASKEDQNAYHAVRSDVVFGLAVGVYQKMWLSLSAGIGKRIELREGGECALEPPCYRAPLRLYTELEGLFNEPAGGTWPSSVRELAAAARRTFEQHVSRAHAAPAPSAPAPSPTASPVPASPFLVHRSRPDLRGLSAAVRAQVRLAARSSELINLWTSLDYDDDEVRYVSCRV